MAHDDRPGFLDRLWHWETHHPIRAFLIFGAVWFVTSCDPRYTRGPLR